MEFDYRDGVVSSTPPDCRCEHNILLADSSAVQNWADPQTFVVGASPFVLYPISLFMGENYSELDLMTERVVGSYASLAYLFSLNQEIADAWGETIATDLSTLPRNKKEMEVYIKSIKHKHGEDFADVFTNLFSSFFTQNDYYQLVDVQFVNTINDCAWTLTVFDAATGNAVDAESDPFIAAYSEEGVLAFWTDDEALVSETPREYYVCYNNLKGVDELCILLSFTVASL